MNAPTAWGEGTSRLHELTLPRAAARVLAACASSRELCVELSFHDPLAERIFTCLGGDSECFSPSELRCTAYRAQLVDHLARHFFARQPHRLLMLQLDQVGRRASDSTCCISTSTCSISRFFANWEAAP